MMSGASPASSRFTESRDACPWVAGDGASSSAVATGGDDGDAEDGDNDSPFDAVPAYARVRLVLEDPENPGRTTELVRLVKLYSAQETWFPNIELDEDENKDEREPLRLLELLRRDRHLSYSAFNSAKLGATGSGSTHVDGRVMP